MPYRPKAGTGTIEQWVGQLPCTQNSVFSAPRGPWSPLRVIPEDHWVWLQNKTKVQNSMSSGGNEDDDDGDGDDLQLKDNMNKA